MEQKPPRYAVYYVPEQGTDLARRASSLVARDIHTGSPLAQPRFDGVAPDELSAMTRDARRYGPHATLKPPFFLKPGLTEENLVQAADEFAGTRAPLPLPALGLERIGSFFALAMRPETEAEEEEAEKVRLLAGDAVSFFDAFRAPPAEEELERRRGRGLTPRQEEYLLRWGYPYVFEEFRFHITLTDGIREPRLAAALEAELRRYTAPAVHANGISAVSICRSGPDGKFTVVHRAEFFMAGHDALSR